jgi:ABC-type sugar transport system substrate-binding protein
VEPTTLWEEKDGVRSGGDAMVRAAAFEIGTEVRGAVTFTVRVPDEFWARIKGGGASATLLLDSDEARGFAAWLDRAADEADRAGPRLYGP